MTAFNELQSLQFAWFTADESATKDIETTFRKVIGTLPDQVQRQRPPATPIPILVASAVVDTTQFRVQAVPGRVDLFVEPVSNDPSNFPFFSDLAVIQNSLSKAKAFCQFTGSAGRQSFVVKIAKRLTNASAFGDEFQKILGVEHNMSGTADLIFQINKVVRLGQLEINRVLRWSAENAQYQQFALNAHGSIAVGPPIGVQNTVLGSAHFVSYVMDINTVPNGKSYDAGGQTSVLEKLGSVVQRCLAFETLGDVK
ncbi:hypothetical protein [Mesorhizobium sp.]|uniref:hypothetical protein n=1 Tax=Mesorhizobium sp. TaxID=1871066 RepID=UPI0012115580|nr:hypothetical protein [Mesorhizobium sp.]TIN10371.1 MAG: hypothetical protein E5Y14_10930 [Mesorhizobium sp.]